MKISKNILAKTFASTLLAAGVLGATFNAQAADYAFDIKGAHAFVQFRVQHLGYSWLYGRFNKFEGHFSFDDADVSASKISGSITSFP